ncbi:MAG: nucleoside 2-deoxyribosyltransferase [Lachnospiraceae bacterium]|nr:nucleoside 2-deoxyribosyltransferase [Lachnospiraceae bacterium]
MKIYFAGSIRAGRDDVEYYNQIIAVLKEYGEVLTEHVGDYSLSLAGQSQFTDKYIHDRDLDWLLSSDVVVAEVTYPSLGVGYEIGIAVKEKVPVVALFRENNKKQLSAMISGCDSINVIKYSDIDALLPKLHDIVRSVL